MGLPRPPSVDLGDSASGPVAVPLDRIDLPGPGEWLLSRSERMGLDELFSGF